MGVKPPWPESRERKTKHNGNRLHYFKVAGEEFELEWHQGETPDQCSSWIRPAQGEHYSTYSPAWFPNMWPRFPELIEPRTAHWMLETIELTHRNAIAEGKRAKAQEIKAALGI